MNWLKCILSETKNNLDATKIKVNLSQEISIVVSILFPGIILFPDDYLVQAHCIAPLPQTAAHLRPSEPPE